MREARLFLVLINPAAFRFECTVVSTFSNGTITTDGMLTLIPGTTNIGVVTGGTGDYVGDR